MNYGLSADVLLSFTLKGTSLHTHLMMSSDLALLQFPGPGPAFRGSFSAWLSATLFSHYCT